MSKEKIKPVAIDHFNRYGYAGVRMAQIAEAAGIRKQSLAYHYPTKKALLSELLGEAVQDETTFVHDFFTRSSRLPWNDRLLQFLQEHKDRFIANPDTHFLFVLSFLPPSEAHEQVMVEYRRYLTALKEEVIPLFAQVPALRMTPEECTTAFLTLMDGLDVQLVYESVSSYEQALAIGWKALLGGICILTN